MTLTAVVIQVREPKKKRLLNSFKWKSKVKVVKAAKLL